MTSTGRGLVAVVLAGGAARRFGTDKLAHPVDGRTLLEHTLAGLGAGVPVLLVGPERPLPGPEQNSTWVREEPPGGGPAAALVAGLRAALAAPLNPDVLVVLPGDAPGAGPGALAMAAALTALAAGTDRALVGVGALVGVDAQGRWQPLQLALRPDVAARLVALAGPDGAGGASARRLVERLQPPATPFPLPPEATLDVDTPDDLARWRPT